MKWISIVLTLVLSGTVLAQNHSSKPIRFIFESIHDHLGNLDVNSKRVKLFSKKDHHLIYEADLYEGKELDEQFFYYKDGKLQRDHRIFHNPHESGDYRLIYDSNGNLIEERNVDGDGEMVEKKTMTYDKDGNMLTHKVEFLHRTEGKMITEDYFEFKYENGKLIEKVGFEGEKEERKVTYKYKQDANSKTVMRYGPDGQITEKWVDEWDDKGRLTKKVHSQYINGVERAKTIDFTYDEHGHILTETMSKSGSSVKMVVSFEYVYDDHGNWIERKETKKKGARETPGPHIKRHIEYYEHDDYDHSPMEVDETYEYETRGGERVKVFVESHTRINNNEGQLEWVVRRNGPTLFQVDEYEYKDGKLDKVIHLQNEWKENAYSTAKYNDAGKIVELNSYSHEGSVDDQIVYEYNKDGKLTKKHETTLGKTVLLEEYEYGDNGKQSKLHLEELGAVYDITYEYDAAGNLIKEVSKPAAKDEETVTTKYEYNDKGWLIKKSHFYGKSKEAHDETVYEYDEWGEMLASMRSKKGVLTTEVRYVYLH